MSCSNRTRGIGFKLKESRLDVRKKYSTVGVVRQRNRFPRVVHAQSLEYSKAKLDGSLSNLIQWKVTLSMTGGLELCDLKGLFLPNPLYDSIDA